MNYREFTTKLLYRGSRDGWYAVDFHRMSDEKGPTITLFKIEDEKKTGDGECFGGYTEAQWSSPENQ
jgi:hypothetical protein